METINRRAREARIRQKKSFPEEGFVRLASILAPGLQEIPYRTGARVQGAPGAARNARSGEPLSASTIHSTLAALKAFSAWLAQQGGYGSRVKTRGR
jgi:hypothetical protein